jgi:Transposase, Mutator family
MRKRRRPRPRPQPDRARTLTPVLLDCPECQHRTYADYNNYRTISTLDGVFRLTLTIRRCPNPACSRFLRPYRPEAEPHFALPYHEFGLDVMATVGRLRYAEHRSIPEIHRELTRRGLILAERTVTNLWDRYDELRATATADPRRLGPLLRPQGRVILAIDGLQPDVGHEVLWVLRDCLSGEILLAQSLWSSTAKDLAGLIDQVRRALPVPITGAVSDGQESLRNAVAQALPGVPHQLCHFHYLREAAKPIYEADRHAKKELKKRVRGIRKIERAAEKKAAEGEDDAEAEIVRGYCAAVRAALTDDGLPPLAAAGLKLHDRLSRIAVSLDQVAAKAGDLPGGLRRRRQLLRRGLEETAALFPAVRESYQWVKRAARILKNEGGLPVKKVRRRLVQLLVRMRRAAATTGEPSVRAGLKQFLKVTKSYWPGLFHCYESADVPRTNNDLEHTFGSHRYHERRSSGRRRASPGLVVTGSARVISGLATRLRPEEGLVLGPDYVADWKGLRAELEARRESRRKQRRFRHDPDAYLKDLEHRCLQLSLPS